MGAVVDASLLVVALTASGQEARWCRAALDQSDIAAPEMALAETTNLFRRMELSGGITRLESTSAHNDLLDLGIELYPFRPFAGRVWELRANLTAYDAWYVAVAEELDWPLLTLDSRLSRASGPRCKVIAPPSDA